MTWPTGPSAHEVETYRILIDHGPLPIEEIADRQGSSVVEARAVLDSLSARGLATGATEGRFRASPPRKALGPILDRTLDQAQQVRAMLAEFDQLYNSRGGGLAPSESVELVNGTENVIRRSDQLFNQVKHQLYAMADAEDLRIHPIDGYPELKSAVEKGVDHRVIVARSLLEISKEITGVNLALGPRTEFRSTSTIPTRMFLLDQATLWIPLLPTEECDNRAMIVHDNPLVVIAAALFDLMWREARPMAIVERGRVTYAAEAVESTDIAILGLLLTGITDQAIAHQLGTSVRTVQRRVRALMEETGATSRIQLGYEAGRRGWLEPAASREDQ
ncbi:MAG: hypothetical protein ACK5LN_09595 [Propioniciclava sp.]